MIKVNDAAIFFCAAFFIVSLSIFSIENNLGSDYLVYEELYRSLDILDFSTCEGIEPGWCIPAQIFNYAGVAFPYFALLLSITIYGLAYFFTRSITRFFSISSWFAVLGLILFSIIAVTPEMASHLTRQYIAGAILLVALLNQKKYLFIPLCLLATLFHVSALIFLPALWGMQSRKPYQVLFAYALILLASLIFLSSNSYGTFINLALSQNDLPRLIYNIFYKLKFVSPIDSSLPIEKSIYLLLGLTPIIFNKNPLLFRIFYINVYFLFFMGFLANFSSNFYVRYFHYGKIFVFASLFCILAYIVSSWQKNKPLKSR